MKRTLIVVYSKSGVTKGLVESLAAELDATVEELHDPTDRSGPIGFLKSGMEAKRGATVPLSPTTHDPASFDRVILASPVWAASPAPALTTYIDSHRGSLPEVAYLVTCGSSGASSAIERLASLAGKPVAAIGFRRKDFLDGKVDDRLRAFVSWIETGAKPFIEPHPEGFAILVELVGTVVSGLRSGIEALLKQGMAIVMPGK